MADRELVTDARVRQMHTSIERLNEWLACYPEQKLDDWQAHQLKAAFDKLWMKVDGSYLREVHASAHGSETRSLDEMDVHRKAS